MSPTAVRMWGCHGEWTHFGGVTSSLSETEALGPKPIIAGGCPGLVPPRVVCHASPPTPAGVVPGLLEAAYQLCGF